MFLIFNLCHMKFEIQEKQNGNVVWTFIWIQLMCMSDSIRELMFAETCCLTNVFLNEYQHALIKFITSLINLTPLSSFQYLVAQLYIRMVH